MSIILSKVLIVQNCTLSSSSYIFYVHVPGFLITRIRIISYTMYTYDGAVA